MERDRINRQKCFVEFRGKVESEFWQHMREAAQCNVRRTVRYGEESCVPARRASMKVQSYLWEQDIQNIDSGEKGQISIEEYLKRLGKIAALLTEEQDDSFRKAADEFRNISQSEADVRASQRIERAISTLGMLSNPDRGSETRRYILNGRFVSCHDQGGYTICN